MNIYNVIKESKVSNLVVKELNASVLVSTFKNNEGIFLADLYVSPNECSKLVLHGTCAPINMIFSRTVKIKL
jgi:hypothetical protein